MAKCMNVRTKNGKREYFIHYVGWKKSWDQWVASDRVLKYTDENMKKVPVKRNASTSRTTTDNVLNSRATSTPVREQVQVVTPSARRNSGALDDSSRTPVPSTSKVGDTSSIVPKPQIRRRRKSESSKYIEFNQLEIHVPPEFFFYVQNTVDKVVLEKRKIKIPVTRTVDSLHKMFIRCLARNVIDKNEFIILRSFAIGVLSIFNVVCPTKLLLDRERASYNELMKTNPTLVPSAIFGVNHLCRLFLQLGSLLRYMELSPSDMQSVQHYSCCYIAFLLSYLEL